MRLRPVVKNVAKEEPILVQETRSTMHLGEPSETLHCCRWCNYYDNKTGCCYANFASSVVNNFTVLEQGDLSLCIDESIVTPENDESLANLDVKLRSFVNSDERAKELADYLYGKIAMYNSRNKDRLADSISTLYDNHENESKGIYINDCESFVCERYI